MAFAPLIAAGISAGIQLWQDHKRANAIKEAEKIQTAAGDKQIATAQAAHQENVGTLRPYTTLGAGAATLLGEGLGIDMSGAMLGGAGNGTPLAPVAAKAVPRPAPVTTAPPSDPSKPYRPPGTPIVREGGDLAMPTSAPAQRQSSYTQPTLTGQAPPSVSMAGTVQMVSPDGNEFADIPLAQVPEWEAKGARRVSAGAR